VERQYRDALAGVAVSFEVGGPGFVWASDDVKGGIEAVRGGFHVEGGESSRWIAFHDRVPWLCWEAERYCYRKDPKSDGPTDEPFKLHDHLMDCLRYLALYPLRWVQPRDRGRKKGYTEEALRQKRIRQAARELRWAGGRDRNFLG
jgi:hypothetical protein